LGKSKHRKQHEHKRRKVSKNYIEITLEYTYSSNNTISNKKTKRNSVPLY